jgi:hypothetical protein
MRTPINGMINGLIMFAFVFAFVAVVLWLGMAVIGALVLAAWDAASRTGFSWDLPAAYWKHLGGWFYSQGWWTLTAVIGFGLSTFAFLNLLFNAPSAETGYFWRSGMKRDTPEWQAANEALGLGEPRPMLSVVRSKGQYPALTWRHALQKKPILDVDRDRLFNAAGEAWCLARALAIFAIFCAGAFVYDVRSAFSGVLIGLTFFVAIPMSVWMGSAQKKRDKMLAEIKAFKAEEGGDEYGNVFEDCRAWVEAEAGALVFYIESPSLGRHRKAYADLISFSADVGEFDLFGRGAQSFANTRAVMANFGLGRMQVARQGAYSLHEVGQLRDTLDENFIIPKTRILEQFANEKRENEPVRQAPAPKEPVQPAHAGAGGNDQDVPTSLG